MADRTDFDTALASLTERLAESVGRPKRRIRGIEVTVDAEDLSVVVGWVTEYEKACEIIRRAAALIKKDPK